MEIKLLSCPLCLKPHFDGVDTLRTALIAVATSQISCPVCNEVLLGLDKLTIHLFSHVTNSLVPNQIYDMDTTIDNRNRTNETILKQMHKETILNDSAVKQMQSETMISDSIVNQMQKETILKQVQQNESNNLQIVKSPNGTISKEIGQESMDLQTQIDIIANKQKNIRCDICNFGFSDENILEMHQKLLHQTLSDKNTGIYSYHCHLCSKKFKMRGSLMVHLRVAHYGFSNDKNSDEKLKGTKGALVKNVDGKITENESKNGVKQWTCDVCFKLFTTKYFLKKHKRLHTGEMPYFCSQCNKSFTFQQSYHKHMLYHSSDKPHVCTECGRAFKELSTLHNHERIHSGERPFVCETCGKCFRQRVSYLVHRRIHTGVMPYQCTACDKTFRYKVSQRSHKCPMSPPGSVVKTNISESQPSPTMQIHSPSVTPNIDECVNGSIQSSSVIINSENEFNANTLNTIVFNAQGEIIGQNFAFDGKNIVTFNGNVDNNKTLEDTSIIGPKEYFNPTTSLDNNNTTDMCFSNETENPDFFTMVMSPSLPDVQGLCLINSPEENKLPKNALHTINEESLKELLYGQNHSHL